MLQLCTTALPPCLGTMYAYYSTASISSLPCRLSHQGTIPPDFKKLNMDLTSSAVHVKKIHISTDCKAGKVQPFIIITIFRCFISLYMIRCRSDSSPWPGWYKIIPATTTSPQNYVVKAVCYKPTHRKNMERS